MNTHPVPANSEEEDAPVESARRQKTRERLIDAASEAFAEFGVLAASVEAIVERAGYTRGAFYSNFDSKEELFFALAEREHRISLAHLEEGLAELLPNFDVPAKDLTLDIVTDVIRAFMEPQNDGLQWCLIQSEFRIMAMRDPAVAARFLAYDDRIVKEMATVLTAAVKVVGLHFTQDPVVVSRLLMSAYESAISDGILRTAAAPDTDGHDGKELALRTLPALVFTFTEPIDGAETGTAPRNTAAATTTR